MTNHSESRRKSKRIAASVPYDEQDGDFLFTRGSKRQKTGKEKTATTTTVVAKEPLEPAEAAAAGAISPERPLLVRRGRGRPSNTKKRAPSPSPLQSGSDNNNPPAASRRPQQRRKLDLTSSPGHDEAQVAPKRRTARERRNSVGASADEQYERETARPGAAGSRINGVKTAKEGGAKKTAAAKPGRKKQQKQKPDSDDDGGGDRDMQGTPKDVDEALTKDPNATKIALPFSDTPINNRNKEFRKKGGAGGGGGRRSSMSMRGRRASSLIESGQSAIPHREVNPSEFFKHIEAEGLSEPRRMKQLLTWCGERALSEKPKHGSTGANAVLGARAIEDQLLKDFGAKSEFSDWFSRDDEPPDTSKAKRPVVIKPNPINVDHERRIAALEARIKQLKETRKSWRALQKPLPQIAPLYPPDADAKTAHIPESQFLDTNEAEMLQSLITTTDNNNKNANAFTQLRSTTASRLRAVQNNMEFKVDSLADSIHKMDLRVLTAGRQADRVLALASERLREREEGERRIAGTKEMPVIEVLRSLGRILPENGG